MRALTAFDKGLSYILRWLCIILFALLVVVVTIQVVVRFTGGGMPWTEALSRFLFIWLGLIGAAFVIGENDDVAIDFLVRKFPAAVVKGVQIFAHLVVATFAVVIMIMGGGRFVSRTWDQTVELLPVTTGQVYLVLPIAGALILIYCLLHIVRAAVRPVEVKSDEDVDIASIVEEGI